ncbi:MAG: cupin domain-containing protein [Deltaproteobacteria bacterium]|nr:cupin domain-containing protein [Deltaproteobacteria bacterium]
MAEISEKLRALRKSRKMTLKEVADGAGCTSAYISQLEKGRANPSIATLKRIASVFDVRIVDLFLEDDGEDEVLLRKDSRMAMGFDTGCAVIESLVKTPENKRMQAFYNRIRPGGGSRGEYTHEGEEFGIVLAGELELTVGDRVYHVKEGDSFYFPSTKSHGFHNRGEADTIVIWVTSPPCF